MLEAPARRTRRRWELLAAAVLAVVSAGILALAWWSFFNNPRLLLTLKGHAVPVCCVAFSPDGTRLASTGAAIHEGPSEVIVWDAATGQPILRLLPPSIPYYSPFSSVAYSPDGKHIAASCYGGPVMVWDVTTGAQLHRLKGASSANFYSVAFSPNGERLAAAYEESGAKKDTPGRRGVKIWDVMGGGELLSFEGHMDRVTSVAFSPDGQRLASGSWDKTVNIWDAHTGQELLTLRGHTWDVWSVVFSPDSQHLASGGRSLDTKGRYGTVGDVWVWDAQTGKEVFSLGGHTELVTGVAFSPDGKRLASAGYDGTAILWDASTGQKLFSLSHAYSCVAFSPDGQRLATRGYGYTVAVWDVSDGK